MFKKSKILALTIGVLLLIYGGVKADSFTRTVKPGDTVTVRVPIKNSLSSPTGPDGIIKVQAYGGIMGSLSSVEWVPLTPQPLERGDSLEVRVTFVLSSDAPDGEEIWLAIGGWVTNTPFCLPEITQEHSGIFTVDAARPTVSVSTPDGLSNVSVDVGTLQLTFSEPMDQALLLDAVSLRSAGTVPPRLINPQWNAGTNTLTLTIDGALAWDTGYFVEIEPTVRDVPGNRINLADTYSWSFTTKPQPDIAEDPDLGGIDFRSINLDYISGDALTGQNLRFVYRAEQAAPEEPTIDLSKNIEKLEDFFFTALAIPNGKLWISLPHSREEFKGGTQSGTEPFDVTAGILTVENCSINPQGLFTATLANRSEKYVANQVVTINVVEEEGKTTSLPLHPAGVMSPGREVSLSQIVGTDYESVSVDVAYIAGDIDIPDEMKGTELGEIMFAADVEMKYTALNEQWHTDIQNEWMEMVKSDPVVYGKIQSVFNAYPHVSWRTWIEPEEFVAQVGEREISVSSATLKALTEVEVCELDLTGYTFSQNKTEDAEIRAYLNGNLLEWKQKFIEEVATKARDIISPALNEAPEYKELREAFVPVAIAQWYKRRSSGLENTGKVLYQDVIDKCNFIVYPTHSWDTPPLVGLGVQITPFDEGYWADLAFRHLGTYTFTDFLGNQRSGYIMGGCTLAAAPSLEVTEPITQATKDLMSEALANRWVKVEDTYYIGDENWAALPDLAPVILNFSPHTPAAGETIIMTALVANASQVDAENFTVSFSGEYTYEDGRTQTWLINRLTIDDLSAGSAEVVTQNWNAGYGSLEGTHKITVRISYGLDESNDANNIISEEISVLRPYPTAIITSPENGAVFGSRSVTLVGSATDLQDGELPDSSLRWASSIDGNLGTGKTLAANLSLGTHTITLTATDSTALRDIDQISITIKSDPPTVVIKSPVDGEEFSEAGTIYFSGSAVDPEDGELSGDSLVWTSNVDGDIGTGNKFELSNLSIGAHTIALAATDSSGLSSAKELPITIVASYPQASINSPDSGDSFYYGKQITFSGSGTDPQNGALSGDHLRWSSNVDGYLGSGETLATANLTLGKHLITLTVTDTEGLSRTDQTSITINPDSPPSASISLPTDGAVFIEGEEVVFTGAAIDIEDGTLPSLVWTSTVDGEIGGTASFTLTTLSVATHLIKFTATDTSGLASTAEITIVVKPAPPTATINLPNEQSFSYGSEIEFAGSGTDGEGYPLPDTSFMWSSSVDGYLHTGGSFTKSDLPIGTHAITLIATDNGGLSDTDEATITIEPPHPPVVSILSPANGRTFVHGHVISFSGSAEDPDGGPLSLVWSSGEEGIGTGSSFASAELLPGTHLIRFAATDPTDLTSEVKVTITILSASPVATITSPPAEAQIFDEGDPVLFEGEATDLEDEDTELLLVWTSSIDGEIGTSRSFVTSDLSLGVHTVILKVTDSDEMTGEAKVTVIIRSPSAALLTSFSDGLEEKSLRLIPPEKQIEYLRIPKNSEVISATMDLNGTLAGIRKQIAVDPTAGKRSLAIYEDKIVWTDKRNGMTDIYMYDLSTSTETPICTNPYNQDDTDIYGDKIIWEDNRHWGSTVYMYDLSKPPEEAETRISSTDFAWGLAIHGDRIVWKGFRGWNGDIFMYDLSEKREIPICTNPAQQRAPDIYGDRIVWEDERNGNWDLYMYDLSTGIETPIYTNPDSQSFSPVIYEDKIVWREYDYSNGHSDIFMYDLSTSQQIHIASHGSYPTIHGDKIIWARGYSIFGIYDLSASQESMLPFYGAGGGAFAFYADRITWGSEYIYVSDLSYPSNVTLDAGDNGENEWQHSGEFNASESVAGAGFTGAINAYVASHPPDRFGNVLVPLVFCSDTPGRVGISNINIQYLEVPPVAISSPIEGEIFAQGETISFSSYGGPPEISLRWVSSIDGELGTESRFSRSDLRYGTHTITLVASDADGTIAEESVNIIVVATDAVLLNNLSDGSKDKVLSFDAGELKTEYLRIPGNVDVLYAAVDLTGKRKVVEEQLIMGLGYKQRSAIYENKVVWQDTRHGKSDIYMYDLSTATETPICTNPYSQINPDIYRDKIVWEDNRNGNWDIYMYDLSAGTEIPICTEPHDQQLPAIYGDKIVWEGYETGSGTHVYMYDLATSTKTVIRPNLTWYEGKQPDIWGDKIVYVGREAGATFNTGHYIYMYDLTTSSEIAICTVPGDQTDPSIHGDRIVWLAGRGIYMYDPVSRQVQIATAQRPGSWLAVYGDKIVWEDRRDGNTDIYMYDLCTLQEVRVTTSQISQREPAIYEDTIVWSNYPSAGNRSISKGMLSAPSNASLDVEGDGDIQWTYEGDFDVFDRPADFSPELIEYLESHAPNEDGTVLVPLVFHSDTPGTISIGNVDIQYSVPLDTIPPAIHSIATSPVLVYSGEALTIAASVTDNDGVAKVTAEVNGIITELALKLGTTDTFEGVMTAPQPGTYSLEINAVDVDGLASSGQTSVTVNPLEPDLTLTSADISLTPPIPSSGDTVAVDIVVRNIGQADASDFDVELLIDNTSIESKPLSVAGASTGSMSFEWETGYRNHSVAIRIDPKNVITEADEDNNSADKNVLIVDTTPPVIQNVNVPIPIYEGQAFAIEAEIIDNAQVAEVSATLDDSTTPLILDPSTDWYEGDLVAPGEGDHILNITATDTGGLVGRKQVTVAILSAKPDLALTTADILLSPLLPVHGGTVTLDAVVRNVGYGAADGFNVEFSVDGAPVESKTLSVPGNSVGAVAFDWQTAHGNHTITVKADSGNVVSESNEDNNTATKTVFVADDSPPVIHEISTPDLIFEDDPFAIQAGVTDNVAVDTVTAEINGSMVPLILDTFTGLYQGEAAALEEGEYALKITATDTSGLQSSRQIKLNVRNPAPDLTLTFADMQLTPESISEGHVLTVEAVVHNNGKQDADNFEVEFLVNDVSQTSGSLSVLGGSTAQIQFNWETSYGNHALTVKADSTNSIAESNETNNEASRAIFVADVTLPPAPVLTSEPSGWTTQTTHAISWDSITDTNGIARYEYRIDHGEWQNIGLNTSFTTLPQSDGLHVALVRAIDNPGNVGEAGIIELYVDTTIPDAPVIEELHCGETAWTAHGSPYFTWAEPGDIGSGVTSYAVKMNEDTPVDIGKVEVYHPSWPTGEHSLKIRALDAVGHESDWSNTITLRIDLDPPSAPAVASSTHSDPEIWYSNDSPKFSWSAPQDHSGISGYYHQLNRESDSIPAFKDDWTEETAHVSAPLNDGIWYFHLVAKDGVGHIGTEAAHYTIRIDTTAPVATAGPDQTVSEGEEATFDGSNSFDYASGVVNYAWDFGDPNDPTAGEGATLSHAYKQNGEYTVTLTVSDAVGYSATDTVKVTVLNLPPVAEAGPDQETDEGTIVTFSGGLTDAGVLDTHTIEWDFGDGKTAEGTLTPQHAYSDNGVYTVTLTVTDDDGGIGTDTLTVIVSNVAPIAEAGPDQEVNEGSTVTFSGSLTDAGVLDTHTIEWDFGDGETAEGTLAPQHAYGDNGVYTVTLKVTDDDGGVGTDTLTVTVNNVAPIVEAGPDQETDEGATVTFAGGFTDPGTLDTHTIRWNFGDGKTAEGTLTPQHAYDDNGIYTVTLTITDDDGGVGTDTLKVTVRNIAPTVQAGPDQETDEGTAISFSGSFTDPGALDTHTIEWDFGDGETAEDTLTPQHTYADNAVYTVTLKVTDDDGGIGTDTLTVTVHNVLPTLLTIENDGPKDEGSAVNFTATFTDPGWLDSHIATWDFGDNTTGEGVVIKEPIPGAIGTVTGTHAYGDNGQYRVTLAIQNHDPAKKKASQAATSSNIIKPEPKSLFKLSKENGYELPYSVEGTSFEVKDNPYFPNLKIVSSEEIKISVVAIDGFVDLVIKATKNSGASTELTISGLEPLVSGGEDSPLIRHLEDGFIKNRFSIDVNSVYTFTQDLSKTHNICFQLSESTIYIIGYPPGSTVYLRDLRLTPNISEEIRILQDDIIVDGTDRVISGQRIYSWGYNDITIRNCTFENSFYGMYIGAGRNFQIYDNTIQASTRGINISYDSENAEVYDNVILPGAITAIWFEGVNGGLCKGNTFEARSIGILVYNSEGIEVVGNVTSGWSFTAIEVTRNSSNNIIADNIITNCSRGIILALGSHHNRLYGNNVSDNGTGFQAYNVGPENLFYRNIITNNIDNQAVDYPAGRCQWDNGVEGNYWSDWESQGIVDTVAPFGIGDSPYEFYGGQDNFPVLKENGWYRGC